MSPQPAATPTGTPAPLAGLRVLDLSTVVAGPFGSEILGYLGADVIRIDAPPAAPPWPLRAAGEPVSEAEGFTWALQRNKRSICLDLKSAGGRASFLDLVRASDVVYDNFRPGVMQRLGLDVATLQAVNPRIVCCSISGFGQQGPWAQVGAYDVAVQALGGSMSITGTGVPGDMPCRLGMPIGDIGAALYAVIGVLAALLQRRRSGRGDALDIALLDVQLAMNSYRVPQVFGAGLRFGVPSPRRGGAGATPYGPFRCGDGAWLVVGVASNHWRAFCEALERTHWADDARFATLTLRQRNQPELESLVEARFLEAGAQTWLERLAARHVPVARVNQIHEAFEHPQALHRGMRVAFDDAGGRCVQAAGSPLRFTGEAPWPQRAPVPVGQDTADVLAQLAGWLARPADVPASRVDEPRDSAIAAMASQSGPLHGVLVLELCGDEPSGTLGTQILADLGATVLKIERPPAGEPEATRVPAGDEPVPPAIAYGFGLNRNKRSLCMDLKQPEGLALLRRLVLEHADLLYDNHKPGVMARLGLDAATLRALKPRLVCCSVSGYGQDGPWAMQPAYDATIQAAGGAMSITGTGEEGSAPVRWGNPIGGIGGALYAVVGVLAALHRRAGSGAGASLDIALFDAQLAMQAYRVPPALAGARYAAQPRRGGSGAMPYGPFLARDDRWFVLGITAQFWPRCCELLGHPEWKDDARMATEALRRANEAHVNAQVGAALRAQDAQEWQRRFVAAGIPGAQVLDITEAFAHPHVALRGMLAGFAAHPIGRRLKVAGDPLHFASRPTTQPAPMPGLGADTRAVLGDLLRIDADAQAGLRAAHAVWWPLGGEVLERPSVV